MKRALLSFFALLGFFAGASALQACRIPPRPVIPIVGDYEAIFLATATSLDSRGANLRIDDMLDGRMPRRDVHLDFSTGDLDFVGRGSLDGQVIVTACWHSGNPFEAGARLVVAVKRNGRQFVASWMRVEDAAVADAFFAQYPAASRRAEKTRLLARWRQGNRERRNASRTPH